MATVLVADGSQSEGEKMKPLYKLEVWRRKDGTLGINNFTFDRGWGEPNQAWKFGAYFCFVGKTATVAVFSHDNAFSREACLEIAIKFIAGGYRFINLDLNTLEATESDGR